MSRPAKFMAYSIRTTNLLKESRFLLPHLLCPLLASCTSGNHDLGRWRPKSRRHQLHVDATPTASHGFPTPSQLLHLPRSCPGCGALTQIVSPEQPGYYGTNRKSVKAFIGRNGQNPSNGHDGESKVFEAVLGAANANLLSQMGLHGGGEKLINGQMS